MIGIKGKIIIVISFVSLSASIAIGWISISKGYDVMKSSAFGNMVLQSEVVKGDFEREMDKIITGTYFLETLIKTQKPSHPSHPEALNQFLVQLEIEMREYAALNKLLSLWIVFNPDFVGGNQMISLFDMNRDGIFAKEIPYNVFDQDLTSPSMDWWNKAIENGSHWSLPYYWENWQMELVSFSKAFYVDGKLAGCYGSDFNYGDFKSKLSSFGDFETGCFTLVDRNYNVIFPPVAYNGQLMIEDKDLIKLISNTPSSGSITFESDDKGTRRFHSSLHLCNGWIMIANVDHDEVLLPVYRYGRFVLFILAIVLVGSILISIGLSYSITAPIFKIIDSFKAAARGNLKTRINTHTHDELDYLTDSFNMFMETIEQLISDLKVQEEKLSKSMLKAEESDRLKTQFLSNISHELRTPLYGIVGFSQLLDDPDIDIESRKLYVDRILRNNDRLLSFVEDIMVFSKLELGQVELHCESFSIEELFTLIETNFNDFISFEPKHLQFIVRKEAIRANCEIYSDKLLLVKIINVLLDNAYKFSHEGAVILSCVCCDSFLRIYVKDTGVGIPLQYRKLIFNKFYKYQPDKNHVYGGSGMGLSMAKGIADLLGGRIKIYSVAGKGSVFTLTIPLRLTNG